MTLGMQELIIPVILLAGVALFGRRTIKKLATDWFAIKKDIAEVKKTAKV